MKKIFNTLESAKTHLQDNKYRYLENHSHREDIFIMYKKGFKVVSVTPFRQTYEPTKYQIQTIR